MATLSLTYKVLGGTGGRISIPSLSGNDGVFETAQSTGDPNPIVRTISQQLAASPTTTSGTITITVT